jgi:hypothetical protein
MPHLVHDATANRGKPVAAAEAEAPLDLGMETREVDPEATLVDGLAHRDRGVLGCRRQPLALGSVRLARNPIMLSASMARLSVTGLNGAADARRGAPPRSRTALSSAP